MRRIYLDCLLIVLVGVVMFARVSTAYFCGFDDFGETYRAAFQDARHPVGIFMTTHFGGTKYRPLNRLSTYVSWMVGGGSALPFRLRNLFFHLMCALCVYGLAWNWTHQRDIASAASLLFCLAPSANQTVVAAIFTNTCAYALLLAAFLLYLYWLDDGRWRLLLSSMALILFSLFFYEPTVMVFPMMAGYVLLCRTAWVRGNKARIVAWTGTSFAVLLIFAFVRHVVVRGENPRVPLGTMVHNLVMYGAALLVPVDPMLSNYLFGTPLPPKIPEGSRFVVILAFACIIVAAAAIAASQRIMVRAGFARLDKRLALFLACSASGVLVPFLAFTPHASETYLYLPTAVYAILLVLVLRAFLTSDVAFAVVVCALIVCFAGGTWFRNQRVAGCGATAARILQQLPISSWKAGKYHILLANAPGKAQEDHYGIYLYHGLSTIQRGDPEDPPAAMYALQLATNNPELNVEVVDPALMRNSSLCDIPRSCYLVQSDGTVQEFTRGPEN
jgi:hypothetical protein